MRYRDATGTEVFQAVQAAGNKCVGTRRTLGVSRGSAADAVGDDDSDNARPANMTDGEKRHLEDGDMYWANQQAGDEFTLNGVGRAFFAAPGTFIMSTGGRSVELCPDVCNLMGATGTLEFEFDGLGCDPPTTPTTTTTTPAPPAPPAPPALAAAHPARNELVLRGL